LVNPSFFGRERKGKDWQRISREFAPVFVHQAVKMAGQKTKEPPLKAVLSGSQGLDY
jgi:hypothetical protein